MFENFEQGWSARITPRTAEILSLVAREMSMREVSIELNCAPSTIRTHLDRFRESFGLAGIAEVRNFWRANCPAWLEDVAVRAGIPYAELRNWDVPDPRAGA